MSNSLKHLCVLQFLNSVQFVIEYTNVCYTGNDDVDTNYIGFRGPLISLKLDRLYLIDSSDRAALHKAYIHSSQS